MLMRWQRMDRGTCSLGEAFLWPEPTCRLTSPRPISVRPPAGFAVWCIRRRQGSVARSVTATIGQPYRIQTSPSLAAGSWTDFTNFTYTWPVVISDPSAAAGPMKFYRAVSP